MLGLSWAEAHKEAGKWEHVISEPVEAGHRPGPRRPHHLPHGNPIPRRRTTHAPTPVALRDVSVGGGFTVSRIPEELEFTPACSSSSRRPTSLPGRRGKLTAGVARRHHHRGDRRPPRRHRRLRQPAASLVTTCGQRLRTLDGAERRDGSSLTDQVLGVLEVALGRCGRRSAARCAPRRPAPTRIDGSGRSWTRARRFGGAGEGDVERASALHLLLEDGGRLDHHRGVELEALHEAHRHDRDLRR